MPSVTTGAVRVTCRTEGVCVMRTDGEQAGGGLRPVNLPYVVLPMRWT
jgi:hypothetical protein